MTYRITRKPNMDLAKKHHAALNAHFNALTALLDSPPEGLEEDEIQSLLESRAAKVVSSARALEAALRGGTYTPRSA